MSRGGGFTVSGDERMHGSPVAALAAFAPTVARNGRR